MTSSFVWILPSSFSFSSISSSTLCLCSYYGKYIKYKDHLNSKKLVKTTNVTKYRLDAEVEVSQDIRYLSEARYLISCDIDTEAI